MTFPRAVLTGFVIGAAGMAMVLDRLPGTTLPRVAPITAAGENGAIVESFFVEAPQDGLAITHSGKLPLGVFPPGAPRFEESAIEHGVALLVKVRNANGEVIGFASELEVHPADGDILTDDVTWDTEWTLVIPGRGVLYLHQQEHSGELGPKVLQPVRDTGKPWTGDWTVQTTAGPAEGRRGVVAGGTGDFAGARGTFVEIDHVTKLDANGALHGDFELRVSRERGS